MVLRQGARYIQYISNDKTDKDFTPISVVTQYALPVAGECDWLPHEKKGEQNVLHHYFNLFYVRMEHSTGM